MGYEVFAAVQHQGNTISEMTWDLIAAEPMWRWGFGALLLHLILGPRAWEWFKRRFR